MKKIKDYINNHPKLKTTLKVLAVIGVIFSVGFNILIIGVGACANTYNNDKNEVKEVVATTPVKRSLDYYDTTYFLSSDDFGFGKFYKGAVGSFGAIFTLDDNRDFVYDFTNNQVNQIEYLVYTDSDSLNTYNRGTIDRVRIGKEVKTHYVNYFINFYTSNSEGVSTFGCDYFVYNKATYNTITMPGNLITTQYWYVNTSSNWTAFLRGLVIVMNGGGGYDLWDWFTPSYEEVYSTDAYENGYQTGYNTGYYEGLNDTDNSPFGLIARAFTSLASILDIQVLPNLSLGVLLFAPLIVAIVIVVVKTIKG